MHLEKEAVDELELAHSYDFDIFKFKELSSDWETSSLAAYLL